MAWARVDDQWWCHPKVLGLSLPARGLWVTALSWSTSEVGRQNGGVVPETLVRMIAAGADIDPLARELEDAGLWSRTDRGWQFHDWAEYQDLSLSEKRAIAGRKGAQKRWQTDSKQLAFDEAETQAPQGNPPDGDEGTSDSKSVARPMAGIPTHTHTQPRESDLLPSVVDPSAGGRRRDEIWDTLVDLFGAPTTKSSRTNRGRVVASLRAAGATGEEILARAQRWPLHFESATLTENALEKHWDRLARPPVRASRGQVRQVEQQLGAAERARLIRREMGGGSE